MYFISSPGDGQYGLLKLLNIASDKNFTLNDIEFSQPVRNEGQSDSRNTKIVVTFKSNKGYYGNKTIYYNRTHISSLPVITINRNNATTYNEILNTINEDYKLFLTPNDIIDGPLPDIVSASITVTLPISNTSFKLYSGTEIEVDLFEPEYSIYKSTDTLTQYICFGFDSLAEYIDDDGSVYRVLVEANSYDCGYIDLNSRIRLIRPAVLNALEEDVSGIFTLEYVNPGDDIVVTVTAPGLTISQSVFNLTTSDPTGTFTVTSNNPIVATISVTSPADIPKPANTTFTFIDRYNTTYGVEEPDISRVIKGELTEDYVVTGYAVDPDEPVTVTIHTQNGLVCTVTSVLLTASEPTATFKVSATNPGNYGISFTNNRSLINPTQLSIVILYPGNITITPPATGVANGIQSDVFTATLVSGIESIVVTPTFSGINTVTPTSFILTPASPTGTFRVTYTGTGNNTLTITNDKSAINPAVYNFNVLVKPTLSITPPVGPILSGINSGNYTITLVNGYKPVVVTLSTNIGNISTTTINLTPGNPTGTFTVRSAVGGSYYVSFSNNGGLTNPTNETVIVEQVYNTSYSVAAPAQLNLIKDIASGNFTVTGTDINPSEPITVTINKTAGLSSNKNEVVLTSAVTSGTFNVQSDTEGDYVVTLTNDRSLSNPNPYNINVLDPGYLTLTPPAGDFFVNVTSGNFTVNLTNGYQAITVSLSSPGATFTPSTLSLSEAQPTKTFTVRYGSSGNKTITVTNSGITVNPAPLLLTLRAVPTITVTAPSGPLYEGANSGNYTITLVNGYKPVTVNVSTNIDVISQTEFTLSPATPTGVFTVRDLTAGTYSLSFTNTENYAITQTLNVNVVIYNGTVVFLTGPSGTYYTGEVSGNFTVSAINIVEPFVVTVNTNADLSSKYTINLSAGTTSSTFTVRFDTAGEGFVGITNDKDYGNPNNITFSIIDRPLAVLELLQLAAAPLIRNKAHSFRMNITNAFGTTITTPYAIGGGTVSGAFNLTEGTPTGTFTFTPSNAGNYQIGITNNRGLANPDVIDVVIINGEILLRAPNTNISAILQSDWFEVELINFDTNTVIDLSLTNYTDGSIYIDPTDVYQTTKILLTNGNRIGRFKLTKPTSGAVTLSVANNNALINPTPINLSFFNPPRLTLTPPVITQAFVNSSIGLFTVSLLDYVEDVTAEIYSDNLVEDTYRNNVVLFLDFQGTIGSLNIKDYSSKNYAIANFITDSLNPTIALSGFEPINGFTSLEYVTGSDYIGITELNNDFSFNSDFTLEVAFKTTAVGKMLLDMNTVSGAYWYLWINLSGEIEWRSSTTVTIIKSTALVNDGQPHEVVFCRTGSAMKLFVDGNIESTFTNSGTIDSTAPTLYIGAQVTNRDSSRDFIGFISKVKITKGTGRWNSNYTVVPLKVAKFTPSTFLLDALNLNKTFEVAVSTSGQYPISVKNNTLAINPNSVNVTFYKTPTVVFTFADTPYYVNEQSKNFTVTLLNPSLSVTFTVTKDNGLSFIETPYGLIGSTFILDGSTPTTTFTLRADTIGTFNLSLTNNKGLNNVSSLSYITTNRTVLALSLTGPLISNIEIGNTSDDFTVSLLGTEIGDITVSPVTIAGVVFTPTSLLLNQSNKEGTFTIESNIADVYSVEINNNGGLDVIEPSSFDFTFRIKSSITVTDTPVKIYEDIESGNFEITLNDPYEEVTVTPVMVGAVFNPTTVTLSPLEPVGTFTIVVDSYGYKSISLDCNPTIDSVPDIDILVLPSLGVSSITIDTPPGVFVNVLSNDFTITLNNGPWKSLDEFGVVSNVAWNGTNEIALSVQPNPLAFIPKDISIELVSDANTFTETNFNLNVINNTDTFKLNSAVSGMFEITTSNNGGITNPTPIEIMIGAELEIDLTAPSELFYKTKPSWPFTVNVDLLNTDVVITPFSNNVNVVFTPTTITLTTAVPTGTFQIKSSVSGSVDIGVTNNLGFTNPNNIGITITDIDEFYEYTELLLLPKVAALTNESYNGSPINTSGPLVAVGVTAFYQNDSVRRTRELVSSNSNIITVINNDERFFNFKKNFTFELIVNRRASSSPYLVLINFNYTTVKARSLVVGIDRINRNLNIINNNQILFSTAVNSLPDVNIWHYLCFECIDGTLSIYIDTGAGTTKIGETPFKMYDMDFQFGPWIGGNNYNLNGNSYNLTNLYYDAIRFTSKARYNGNPISLTDLTERYLSTGSPSIRMFKPNSSFVDKNTISESFTVTGYLLDRAVTITPIATGNVSFIPSSAIITSVTPTATFTCVSNDPGSYTVSVTTDCYLECKDSFVITVIAPDPLFNNVLLLLKTNGLVNNFSNTSVLDKSNYKRTLNNLTQYSAYILKSDFARFDKAIEQLTNSSLSGYTFLTSETAFNLNNTNFCIEGSCYFNNLLDTISEATIFDTSMSGDLASGGFRVIVKTASRKLLVAGFDEFTYLIPEENTPGTLPDPYINFSFAIEYKDGRLSIYIDGSLYASAVTAIPVRVGSQNIRLATSSKGSIQYFFPGGIDQLRLTRDNYRYGGNYTVSATPFPQSGTMSIVLTKPVGNYNIFNTEISKVFTITTVNTKNPCAITFESDTPGIVFDPPSLTILPDSPISTFTISGVPGEYVITIKNSLLIDFNEVINFTIFDSTESNIDINTSILKQVFNNENIYLNTTIINPVVPVAVDLVIDPLYGDPYKDNVVIMMDFQGPIGSKKIINHANEKYEITTNGSNVDLNQQYFHYGKSNLSFPTATGNLLIYNPVLDSNDFILNNDFTLEIDFYYIANASILLSNGGNAVGDNGIRITVGSNVLYVSKYNGSNWVPTGIPLLGNSFNKLAISRTNGVIKVFHNGVQQGVSINDNLPIGNYKQWFVLGGELNSLAGNSTYVFKGAISKFKLTNGIGRYTENYTPEALYYPTFLPELPSQFTEVDYEKIFAVTNTSNKQFRLKPSNDRKLLNPNSFILGFNPIPIIGLITPNLLLIPKSDISLDYFITLTNSSASPVVITIIPDPGLVIEDFTPELSQIATNQFLMDINTSLLKLNFLSNTVGNYNIAFSNDRGLPNPDPIIATVKIPDIFITGPNPANEIYINESSFDLSIGIDIVNTPITIIVTLTNGLSFDDLDSGIKTRNYIVSPGTLNYQFKITSTVGYTTQQITVTNLNNVNNPNVLDIFVIDRPTIPNNLQTTDFNIYLVGEDTNNRDINLFQGFF